MLDARGDEFDRTCRTDSRRSPWTTPAASLDLLLWPVFISKCEFMLLKVSRDKKTIFLTLISHNTHFASVIYSIFSIITIGNSGFNIHNDLSI